MIDRTMKGIYPILSIPFNAEGQIDLEDLQKETEWEIEAGVDGIGIGMASEVYKLTEDERDLVLQTVVKQADGRVKIVMNTGAEGAQVAIQWSRRAEELGADALMIRPPTYTASHADEVVRYFTNIAENVSIPIFLQDQGGAAIAPGLAVRIARQSENLCYIKVEAPPTVPRTTEVVNLRGDSGLIVFGGAGGNFLIEEARRGSIGSMSGHTMPDIFVKIWKMFHDGQEEQAEREFRKYPPLIRTLNQGYGLALWLSKEVLVKRGVFKVAYARNPALAPDRTQLHELHRIIEELGLDSKAAVA